MPEIVILPIPVIPSHFGVSLISIIFDPQTEPYDTFKIPNLNKFH